MPKKSAVSNTERQPAASLAGPPRLMRKSPWSLAGDSTARLPLMTLLTCQAVWVGVCLLVPAGSRRSGR